MVVFLNSNLYLAVAQKVAYYASFFFKWMGGSTVGGKVADSRRAWACGWLTPPNSCSVEMVINYTRKPILRLELPHVVP